MFVFFVLGLCRFQAHKEQQVEVFSVFHGFIQFVFLIPKFRNIDGGVVIGSDVYACFWCRCFHGKFLWLLNYATKIADAY